MYGCMTMNHSSAWQLQTNEPMYSFILKLSFLLSVMSSQELQKQLTGISQFGVRNNPKIVQNIVWYGIIMLYE